LIVSEDTVVFNNSCYWFVKKGGGDQDNLGYEAATKAWRTSFNLKLTENIFIQTKDEMKE
jgi:hypothetical protein